VVIDKVVVHHTLNTLTVIGIGLAVFMVFTAAMTWVRQYLNPPHRQSYRRRAGPAGVLSTCSGCRRVTSSTGPRVYLWHDSTASKPGVLREILVGDGQEVKAGQVLLRMDTEVTDADQTTVETDLMLRRLQLRRIESELAGVPFTARSGDRTDLIQQVTAQSLANPQSLREPARERAGVARESPAGPEWRDGDGIPAQADRADLC